MPADSAFNLPHSPIAALGTIVLLVAYGVAAFTMFAGIVGNLTARRRLVASSVQGLYGFFALMLIASALMIYAFVTHDYTIKYVSRYSDTTMPVWYKIAAYWGGLDGSMMFWVFVLSVFAAIAVRANRQRHADMMGYVVAVIMIAQLFFLSILIYSKNPFATFLTTPPIDGEGLNPLLQNYWMVIHPPALYIGFVAATIPFAFAIAALASGRLDNLWISSVRSWMLICWFFLSFGLILGGRWAYEELGWGGYWAWDPVENAGLLPWFTATAYLHSAIIQEQRGMLKVWNMLLVITTFFLTIFGTFMTRSGVVQSVHAFGEDNQLAILFILFMGTILIASFGLLIFRSPRLRAANSLESFVSREFAFLLNNWILLACAFFVLFATMFPTISEAMDGQRISVGPEFFNKWMTPLGLVLLFLAGAAPLLAWRRSTRERLYSQFMFPVALMVLTIAALAILMPQTLVRTSIFSKHLRLPVTLVNFGLVAFTIGSIGQEFYKGIKVRAKQTGTGYGASLIGLTLSKRRKYGGYIIHLGIAIMFFGIAGKAYETMEDYTVERPGESFKVGPYKFSYDALEVEANDHVRIVRGVVALSLNGEKLGVLTPERRQYTKAEQPTTEVAVKSRLKEDVYIVLTGFDERSKLANFRVYLNPLINWVWFGFVWLMFGTAICLVPQSVIDNMGPKKRTKLGRAGEVAILVLTIGAVTFGMVAAARAQGGAPQHDEKAASGGMSHDDGTGYAHVCRPADGDSTAKALMKELVCECGGCQRENLYECKCGFAAKERCKVLELLGQMDRSGKDKDQAAYNAVIKAFVAEYGGEHVLSTPRSRWSWLLPYLAVGGGFVIMAFVTRRWVRRGQAAAASTATNLPDEDEDYADLLDDELRDTE